MTDLHPNARRVRDAARDRGIVVFVDPDLLTHDEVWAAAGTPHDAFGLAPADLVAASEGQVVDLKR